MEKRFIIKAEINKGYLYAYKHPSAYDRTTKNKDLALRFKSQLAALRAEEDYNDSYPDVTFRLEEV